MRKLNYLLTAGALAFAGNAAALTIDSSNWGSCVGASSCNIGSATLTTDPNDLLMVQKTYGGATGLGFDGVKNGEIGIGEDLHITFGKEQGELIADFTLVFLYNGPEFQDVAEIAKVTAVDIFGVTSTYTLSVSGLVDDLALWSGSEGTVSNCGSTTVNNGGCFSLSNPFGDTALRSISFTALPGGLPFDGPGRDQSDFALGSLTTAVPEPGALALLGMGLVGLGLSRRRQQQGS